MVKNKSMKARKIKKKPFYQDMLSKNLREHFSMSEFTKKTSG